MEEGNTISMSSCKLMNFNVEDILALPQLQQGRLNKNIKTTDIFAAVKEIKTI